MVHTSVIIILLFLLLQMAFRCFGLSGASSSSTFKLYPPLANAKILHLVSSTCSLASVRAHLPFQRLVNIDELLYLTAVIPQVLSTLFSPRSMVRSGRCTALTHHCISRVVHLITTRAKCMYLCQMPQNATYILEMGRASARHEHQTA